MNVNDVVLAVYSMVEDGEFETYEEACEFMGYDGEVMLEICAAISEDMRLV